MNNKQTVEFLIADIQRVEESKKEVNGKDRVTVVRLHADTFLKIAYVFVGRYEVATIDDNKKTNQ